MLIRKHVSAPMVILIKKLNEILRGWANYHRYVVSSEAFSRIDTYVFEELWRMVRRRHQRKSEQWLKQKYWTASGLKHVFAIRSKDREGRIRVYQVVRISGIGRTRYIKIKAAANPYMPEFAGYFWRRRHDKQAKSLGALSARQFRAQYV